MKKAFRTTCGSHFVQGTLQCVDTLRKMLKHKTKFRFITLNAFKVVCERQPVNSVSGALKRVIRANSSIV